MTRKINHIGIAVKSIAASVPFYREQLGMHEEGSEVVAEQKVKVAFFAIGESRIELLEPTRPDANMAKFLERKGEGLHHICFQTADVDGELETLKSKEVALVDQKSRAGLAGMICFLHPKASRGVLVELATPMDMYRG